MANLITGARSGFGKYAYEKLEGFCLTRETKKEEIERLQGLKLNTIIHCAFNSRSDINSSSLYSYIQDNVLLTQTLSKIPHKKFIFISTIDVYPRAQEIHKEEEIIKLTSLNNPYSITKLMSESIVQNKCSKPLILRCSAFLGKGCKKNSLVKISNDVTCLSLSGESKFNYILYDDVLSFLEYSIKNNLGGIYNVTSSKNISLKEVADILNKKVNFGSYIYNTGKINNDKITSIFPKFKKTSKEVIKEFINKTK